VEVCAADAAAAHPDQDLPRHRLGTRKLGELEGVGIDGSWVDDLPRVHRAGLSRIV
jgi:hypothetical protein